MDSATLDTKLVQLEAWIRENQAAALERFQLFAPSASLHSFHAHIGRNNNTFVDSVRTRFAGPQEFIARWIEGLHAKLDEIVSTGRRGYGGRLLSEQLVLKCLQDDLLRKYTFKFLERNFYRNYQARTRQKPDDALWSVWFGSGDLSWGLIIAPAHRHNAWTNDKSQMRRESYAYWTVGHILATGLHDPTSSEPLKFADLHEFEVFYRSVLKRISNSLYERAVCDRYLAYLKRSSNPLAEPMLIPEFRYAGFERKHEHRLDFTVLNGHTFDFTGFEFSPSSTHIRIEKLENYSKTELNRKLALSWQKEVSKRNAYFLTYGVPVVTFADDDLKDVDACFHRIESALRARSAPMTTIQGALSAITLKHGAA